MFWLAQFFKGGKTLSQGIKEFFKINGRMPNSRETLKMKDIFRQSQSNVIPFRYKKTFKKELDEILTEKPKKVTKKEPTLADVLEGKTIEDAQGRTWDFDKFKWRAEDAPLKGGKPKLITETEVIPKEPSLTKDDFFRIKQGLSTKIKLNTLRENKQLVKDLINRKNVEFNSLDRIGKKEILDRVTINIKNAKADFATPIKPDDLASGGIAGQLHLNRSGYAGGKSTFPKQLSLFERPKIGDALKKLSDAELKRQMKEMKKRWGVSVSNKASGGRVSLTKGGLAHVLGV